MLNHWKRDDLDRWKFHEKIKAANGGIVKKNADNETSLEQLEKNIYKYIG